MDDCEVLVIGGGAMGLATAWQLARRGVAVRLVEQYGPGHHEGASHGAARNFNPAYLEPELLERFQEAHRLWRELEVETGTTVLDLVGLITHGRSPLIRRVGEALAATDIPAEVLPAAEAQSRWTGIRLDGEVLHTPEAGRIRASDSLRALAAAASAQGAMLSWNTRAIEIEPDDEGVHVTLEPWGAARAAAAGVPLAGSVVSPPAEATEGTGARVRVRARTVVVATNAWAPRMLAGVVALPQLTVTQETPVHFTRFDDRCTWPSFNHVPGPDDGTPWWSTIYGMLTPGEGVKAGWHRVGPTVDPDARTFRAVPQQTRDLQEYARRWLPGVDAGTVDEISCTYTSAVDGYFVVDRIGRVVVLSGFAGEGFKFVPAIGRLGADLAQGGSAPALFSASRVRRPLADGAVLGAFMRH